MANHLLMTIASTLVFSGPVRSAAGDGSMHPLPGLVVSRSRRNRRQTPLVEEPDAQERNV
jgi:hypothetical protein